MEIKNKSLNNRERNVREGMERQDFSLLKELDLLHQRRRKHGTTIPPPATFIITLSIKHGRGLHWRRRGERKGADGRRAQDLGKGGEVMEEGGGKMRMERGGEQRGF